MKRKKLSFINVVGCPRRLEPKLLAKIIVCMIALCYIPFFFPSYIPKFQVPPTNNSPKNKIETNTIKTIEIFEQDNQDLLEKNNVIFEEDNRDLQKKNNDFEYINNLGLLGVMDQAKTDGAKAWEELNNVAQIAPTPSKANSNVTIAKGLVCPPSLSASSKSLHALGTRLFPLPCGMKFGSNITIIGKPRPTQWKYNSLNEQERKVSQFFIEVQGFKLGKNEMHPPTLFHLNPRLHGDWSGKPIIEHNSRHGQDQWGKAQRCDGRKHEGQVDDQPKCEDWLQIEDDQSVPILAKESWWNKKVSLFEKEKLKKGYPFVEGQDFSLTIHAGIEGFHVILDNRHISSFPYQHGFSITESSGIVIGGDVDVDSIKVTSLPQDDTWKALPLPTKEVELFVGIMSSSNHFVERMAIRKTWIQSNSIRSSQVVARFFVALHKSKLINLQLMEEANYYGDIIILSFIDRYDIVVLKTLEICKFGYYNVTAKYIMKCDDDAFVRIDGILEEVQEKAITQGLYMGNINKGHLPLRHGKWAVTIEEWPNEQRYPTYANGPGYVLSKDIVEFIVEQDKKQKLQFFKMEDVNVGLWANQFAKEKYPVNYVDMKRFTQDYCQNNYLCIHYQSPRQMMCLWNKLLATKEAKCC